MSDDTYCMLAAQFEEKRIQEWPVIVEPKHDGIRTLVVCGDGNIKFLTRNANHLPSIQHLEDHFLRWKDGSLLVFDGECTVEGETFTDGSGLLRRLSEKADKAILTLFDVQKVGDVNDRRAFIESYFPHGPIHLTQQLLANSVEEIRAIYKRYRAAGHEGAIIKIPSSTYMFRRHWSWMKMKAVETYEVTIYDIYEGKGKYVGMMGGFWCKTETGIVKVGGGWDDAQRQKMWERWHYGDFHDGLMGAVIEITGQEKSKKGSVRHPNFVKFRDDK